MALFNMIKSGIYSNNDVILIYKQSRHIYSLVGFKSVFLFVGPDKMLVPPTKEGAGLNPDKENILFI